VATRPDILFVSPEYTTGNCTSDLGTAYIIAYLKQEGMSAEQFYCYKPLTLAQLARHILKTGAPMIGFSCYNANYFLIKSLCKELKRLSPDIFIITGGPTATFSDGIVLQNIPAIDICVRGEGELTTKEIIEHFKGGRPFHSIAGISYRLNGETVRTSERPLRQGGSRTPETSLDIFPSPYLNNPSHIAHLIKHEKEIPLITSRGCVFKCTYCNCTVISQHTIRSHSVERIVSELKLIHDTVQEKEKRTVQIHDDFFTFNHKRVERICNGIIKNRLDLKITITTRADFVNEKILCLLYKAGVRTVNFGLESAHPKSLFRIKKIRLHFGKTNDYRPEKRFLKRFKSSVAAAKKIGLEVDISILLGLPGETRKDILRTIDFARRLKIRRCYHNYLAVYPGTELFTKYAGSQATDSEEWLRCPSDRLPGALPADPLARIPSANNSDAAITARHSASLSHAFLMGFLKNEPGKKHVPSFFFKDDRAPILKTINKLPLQSLIFLAHCTNGAFATRETTELRHMRVAHALSMPPGHSCIDFHALETYDPYHKRYEKFSHSSSKFKLSDAFSDKDVGNKKILFEISAKSDIIELKKLLKMPDLVHTVLADNSPGFILRDACRWTRFCPAKKFDRFMVDKELCLSSCFHGRALGKFGDPFEKIKKNYLDFLRSERKKRGCHNCPAQKQCSQCPFLGNIPYEEFCGIRRTYATRLDNFIAVLMAKNIMSTLPEQPANKTMKFLTDTH